MKQNQRGVGVYHKYDVKRTDGQSEPGKKHANCQYFVLDLECDGYAIPAMAAYAKACREKYPALAQDIEDSITGRLRPANCGCREALCPHTVFYEPVLKFGRNREDK